jgi:photosystem II stability/assembly factor-like uncharacterized protein
MKRLARLSAFLVLAFVLQASRSANAQWQIENSGTTADLRGIDNVGAGVAWASGTNGTVLRTEDGGYLWQSCSIPPGADHLDFRGIQAFDANTAIVMSSGKGDLSRLYKTTDGCHTWKLIFTNPDKDGFWDDLAFYDPIHATILGDPVGGKFAVWLTRDGTNWEKETDPGLTGSADLSAFAASNSSLLWAKPVIEAFGTGGTDAKLYWWGWRMTGDGLSTRHRTIFCWSAKSLPLRSGPTAGIFSIGYRYNAGNEFSQLFDRMVVVGGDYEKPEEPNGTAAYTVDAGEHWEASATPPHGFRSAVAYDTDANTWITVGPDGTDISTDDGKNWRALHPDPASHEALDADRNWNALSLPFVVGPHGRIGKLNPHALVSH